MSRNDPISVARRLRKQLGPLRFGPPVTHVYNPLGYAFAPMQSFLERYGTGPREILLLGMNPGPYGMAQTGVPFGEICAVRDWLKITGKVGKPTPEHPKRPILGFECPRSEVSGARIWGWARERFGTPERFFARFMIINYCPLVFMEETGRNRTPDKLAAAERAPLFAACDEALRTQIEYYQPEWVLGIGAFAEQCAKRVLKDAPHSPKIGRILHPSPASPLANRGWAQAAEKELAALGIRLAPGP